MVTLTAMPESGYRLFKWTGTDYDGSTARTNYVTMAADTKVTVEFEKRIVRTLDVPGKYPNIQTRSVQQGKAIPLL